VSENEVVVVGRGFPVSGTTFQSCWFLVGLVNLMCCDRIAMFCSSGIVRIIFPLGSSRAPVSGRLLRGLYAAGKCVPVNTPQAQECAELALWTHLGPSSRATLNAGALVKG